MLIVLQILVVIEYQLCALILIIFFMPFEDYFLRFFTFSPLLTIFLALPSIKRLNFGIFVGFVFLKILNLGCLIITRDHFHFRLIKINERIRKIVFKIFVWYDKFSTRFVWFNFKVKTLTRVLI